MNITYGTLESSPPPGFFAKVKFPTLARLNERTGDGRLIRNPGFGTRDLPLSILQQQLTGGGHDNSVVVGRLDSMTIDGNNVSAEGWLTDTPEGRAAFLGLANKSYRGNSVDLAEVEVAVNPRFEDDFIDEQGFVHLATMYVDFIQSKLAATTLVTTPAFAEAHATVEEQITASMGPAGYPEITAVGGWSVQLHESEIELTASMAAAEQIVQEYDAFHQPEPDAPQALIIDERGWVSFHLGEWSSCHTGIQDSCVMIPKSRKFYGDYMKRTVLTDKGLVPTGMVFLFGGHPKFASKAEIDAAYGGIENAWADIHIVDGKFGPWASGKVRPGVTPEQLYAARASGVSGHWFDGELYAVVSVNADGFNVPRRLQTDENGHVQLIASTAPCDCNADTLSEAELVWLQLQLADLED